MADFGEADVARLLGDAGIVRHRAKIVSADQHARRRCLAIVEEAGSLAAFLWRYEAPAASRPKRLDITTARTLTESDESRALAKALRARGWSFVGPTTLYAFMQSVGLVNDHIEGCHVRDVCEAERARFVRPT